MSNVYFVSFIKKKIVSSFDRAVFVESFIDKVDEKMAAVKVLLLSALVCCTALAFSVKSEG